MLLREAVRKFDAQSPLLRAMAESNAAVRPLLGRARRLIAAARHVQLKEAELDKLDDDDDHIVLCEWCWEWHVVSAAWLCANPKGGPG